MNELARKIDGVVEARRKEIIGFLQGLIGAQTGGEERVQALVAEAAGALGCKVETVRYRPASVPMVAEFAASGGLAEAERASVVARYPAAGGGRSVIFFAHPDGEPIAGTQGWKHEPFAGAIADGRIYGWGVADDLAGVAVMLQGLGAVLGTGLVPAGEVVLASTPSKRHARGVSALLHGGLRADAAVYLHPAESGVGMREIKAFASGQLEFRLTVQGQPPQTSEPSHTAFAHRAVNPLDKAWLLYAALRRLDESRGRRVHHPALEAAVGRSTNLLVSAIESEGAAFGRVADSCVLAATLSFPPSESLAEVQAEIAAAVQQAARQDPWLAANPPRLDWVAGVSGAEIGDDHPLYRVVAGAVTSVTGDVPHVNPLHTASDIRNPILQAGIPTVGLGPLAGDLTQNGRHDEWVDVEDYLRAVKVAARITAGWCGVVRSS